MTTQVAMHNPEEVHNLQTGAAEEAMEVRDLILLLDGNATRDVVVAFRFLLPQC